jgi:hypothetical protein
MKTKILTWSTTPKDGWWQIVFIPTVTMYSNAYGDEKHVAINFEWLFWSLTILTYTEYDKGTIYHP